MLNKLIVFAAAICSLLLFFCIDNPQDNAPPLTIVAVGADSEISIRDTFTVNVDTAGSATSAIRCCWRREGSWTIDTSRSFVYKTSWMFPDTGFKRIIVWAYDTTGEREQSGFDTVTVHVRAISPTVVLYADSSASVNDTVIMRAGGTDRDGTVERFEWQVGSKGMFVTPASRNSLAILWTRADTGHAVVILYAIDNDGLRSAPDSQVVRIVGKTPACSLVGDTARSINDTATFVCTGVDADGVIKEYQWSIGGGSPGWLSTTTGVLKKTWRSTDTGFQAVHVRVVDDDGYVSAPESLVVHVFARSPQLTLKGQLQVVVDDTIRFTARAIDSDGRIIRYDWSIETDTGNVAFSTTDSLIRFVWVEADTGLRKVSVSVTDDDSLKSASAVFSIRVSSILKPFADITLSSLDTLKVKRTLVDTTRHVVMFYWDANGGDWDDSSTSAERAVYYTGITPVYLVCGVRVAEGRYFRDTTVITFNRPPVFDSLSLFGVDTVWMGERALPGRLPIGCKVSDPDGETLVARLIWRSDTITGSLPATLTVDTTGSYPWSITVQDRFGNSVTRAGKIVIGIEHTVCFAGHSIVAGLGGDNIVGGFRAGVLAGLRDSIGTLERVRAVGPLVTTQMAGNPIDDSSFAVSGSLAHEMFLLMDRAYKNLTADIWVLMFGVNGDFKQSEMQSTAAMIGQMFSRNPHARVYVLLSPPNAGGSTVQRNYYNNNIRDTVALKMKSDSSAFLVRADTVLSNGSTIYSNLFYDDVHPNQTGYDRLSDEILRVMWSSAKPVFPVRKKE